MGITKKRDWPIVEYAHKVGKSTAEFTLKDFAEYMKWWMKQPERKDLTKVTPAQHAQYNKDVNNMKKWRAQQAETVEIVDMSEEVEEVEAEVEEIICSMELTKVDVEALLFTINKLFEDYDFEGHEYQVSLNQLKEGLERA